MNRIAQNLKALRMQIDTVAKTSGRSADGIKLIAVSKTHGQEAIRAALVAGQQVFGENRVQEARTKFAALRAGHPGLELHLIGPLQTNKVDDAVRLFDVIQTVDRTKLVDALVKSIKKIGRTPKLYVEVNVGREPQKAGVIPEDLNVFLRYCHTTCGLTIDGLMCIPPHGETPAPYFRQLKKLADEHELTTISMGMSGDFEEAIRCGATEIRLGTAIFGKR